MDRLPKMNFVEARLDVLFRNYFEIISKKLALSMHAKKTHFSLGNVYNFTSSPQRLRREEDRHQTNTLGFNRYKV